MTEKKDGIRDKRSTEVYNLLHQPYNFPHNYNQPEPVAAEARWGEINMVIGNCIQVIIYKFLQLE